MRQGVGAAQLLTQLAHRRTLAPDAGVHTHDPGVVLVDDRIQRQAGLACLTVAQDELPLSQANWDRGVDGLDARVQGLVHRLPLHDAWWFPFERRFLGDSQWPPPIAGMAQGIDNPAEKGVADGRRDQPTGTRDRAPRLDSFVRPVQHAAYLVAAKVEHLALHAVGEHDNFVLPGIGKTLHVGNTVADGAYTSDVLHVESVVSVTRPRVQVAEHRFELGLPVHATDSACRSASVCSRLRSTTVC